MLEITGNLWILHLSGVAFKLSLHLMIQLPLIDAYLHENAGSIVSGTQCRPNPNLSESLG